jgi:hypothetical protein
MQLRFFIIITVFWDQKICARTSSNFTEASQIIEKYGVTHIFVCFDDMMKVGWMFKAVGLEPADYVLFRNSIQEFTDAGRETMVAKLLENRDTGFDLIYEDEEILIYCVS